MRLLRTNSSKTTFEESLVNFKQRLRASGYPKIIIERSLSGVSFASRPSALTQKRKTNARVLPFVTTYHPAVTSIKTDNDGTLGPYTKPAIVKNDLFENLR